MKSRLLIIIGIAISIGISFAYAESEKYNLEIIGMKDTYYAGEQYHFDYILSGFGVPCGSTEVSFPDKDGNYVGIGSDSLCEAKAKNYNFVYDTRINHSSTTATVKIDTPGDYYISIEFERFLRLPVNVIHYFTVLSNATQTGSDEIGKTICLGGPSMLLNDDCVRIGIYDGATGDEIFFPPLKQIKKGIAVLDIQCNEPLILITKYDDSPACVREQSIPKLIERGWNKPTSVTEPGPPPISQEQLNYIQNCDPLLHKETLHDITIETETQWYDLQYCMWMPHYPDVSNIDNCVDLFNTLYDFHMSPGPNCGLQRYNEDGTPRGICTPKPFLSSMWSDDNLKNSKCIENYPEWAHKTQANDDVFYVFEQMDKYQDRKLNRVLDQCEEQKPNKKTRYFENYTHSINSESCKWN